jgi:hypothetical protein
MTRQPQDTLELTKQLQVSISTIGGHTFDEMWRNMLPLVMRANETNLLNNAQSAYSNHSQSLQSVGPTLPWTTSSNFREQLVATMPSWLW